jgi:hypothetical protein
MEEIIEGRQYLIDLIQYIGAKEVYINYGNHDIRMGAYFAKNLDSDILELAPNNAIELIVEDGFRHYNKRTMQKVYYPPIKDAFVDLGINVHYVNDWKIKLGKVWFVHPLAYRQGNLATAEKAKGYLQDIDTEPFDAVVMAHTHKVGHTKIGRINLYEQGACCKTDEMNYVDGKLMKPQKEGFMFIALDKEGNLIEDKTKVLNLDYNKCLDYLKDNNIKLDIIFLDPPYKNECLNDIIDKILVYDLLNNNGIIVCEVDKDYLNKDFSNLEIIKNRKYGDKFIIIYEKN